MIFKRNIWCILNDTVLTCISLILCLIQLALLFGGIYITYKHNGHLGEYANVLIGCEVGTFFVSADLCWAIFGPACVIRGQVLRVYKAFLHVPEKILIKNINKIEIGKKVYLYFINSRQQPDGCYVNLRGEDVEHFIKAISEQHHNVSVERV